jgi:hypothetical protein
MIALILAAQLSLQPLAQPPVLAPPPPLGRRSGDLIRTLPNKDLCNANPGHLEVSLAQPAQPAALYRRGDRPPNGLRDWVAYPNGQLCLVETPR